MNSRVSEHFGSAPFYIFVDVDGDGVKRWYTRENEAAGLERKRGITVTNMIVEEDATVLLSDELGDGPFHVLRDNFIGTYPVVGGSSVRDALDQLISGRLVLRSDGDKKEEKKV